MDVQTALIYVGVVVVSAVVILLVSMFGIKEKSYEEAIAEQRKLPDDLLLSKKDKNKEKKHKNKSAKKVKEKKEEKEEKDEKDEKPEHVQFEETPQILPPEPLPREGNKASKKQGKPEKVKPILINKDEPLAIVTELSPSQPLSGEINHFELIQPKDDLELIRSHSKENLQQINQSEPVISKSPKDTPTKLKKNVKEPVKKKDETIKEEKKEINVNVNASSTTSKDGIKDSKDQQKDAATKDLKEAVKDPVPSVQLSNKESKKTKKKNDILAQIGGDKDAVNVSLLMLFIQKAELSRSEIQILIDQLLNKQLDNPSEHSEWTEGRADPVIKLKKQLAEKEKALADEHEVSVAFQNKLKELRAEFNAEKSRLSANVRQLEEALNNKVTEAQTLHTRMQHILESHAAEKQGFARQIEQLQTKVNEDAVIIHKMQEDQGQTQGHMQQELIAQRKQMEVVQLEFAQMHENESALKAQLAQKHAEVQELQNELQVSCSNSTSEIEMLQQQLGIMQTQLIHKEGQLQHFQDASDRLQEVVRELEESHHANTDLDHRLKNSHRHEQELQKQVNSLQKELNAAKVEASEVSSLKSELAKVQAELLKVDSELSLSKNEAKSEAVEITTLKAVLGNKEEEIKKCKEELDFTYNELNKSKEELKYAEFRYNDLQKELEKLKGEFLQAVNNIAQLQDEVVKYQNASRNLQEELAEFHTNLAKAHEQIKVANEAGSELQVLKAELQRLQTGEKKTSETQIRMERLQEEYDNLSAQLVNYTEIQKEIKKLREENASLESQLAATTERSAADGHENGIEEKLQKTNTVLLEHNNLLAQKNSQLDALTTELTHKEAELSRLNAQIEALQNDMDNQKSLVVQLQSDLDAQRSKNNELRTKNWKVMEALNATELRAKSNNGKGIVEAAQKLKAEQQELTKAFLQRVFPDIKVTESSHEQWLNVFENKVYTYINTLKDKNTVDVTSEVEKQNKNLQGMVTHYKQIIDDTEGMLNKLQSHIESEESRWQAQLQQKESEVSNLRVELTELKTKLNANEKSQEKIFELETKLKDALSLGEQANAELSVLRIAKKSVANGNMCNHDLAALEKLQEEKARLSEELQAEIHKRSTLDAAIVKLNALVETCESSLAQEKNRVAQLQQEISQLKSEVCGGCSSSEQSMLNGPPTSDSPIPEQLDNHISEMQTPLAAQNLIAALESTLLKNTEFANCSMTKSMNLVQSQQEIDTSSLTSKYSSKSCHMTDHNTQASWHPLIGQQHKKHKKKRKSTKKSTAKRRRFAGWFRKKVTSKNKLR